ncbi:MAG TPA: hypothetical protein VIA64_17210 [Burkholderiales bacterium]
MRTPLIALSILAACAGALLAARADTKFQNLTAEQGRTLLALARDYDPGDEERAESAYAACVARYDADAADPAKRAPIEESFVLIDGATRRMGYKQYADITDNYERLRLAKMLGERGWLKQFRTDVAACLASSGR